VTRRVREKIAQNVAQPIFAKMNAQFLPWKKVALKLGLLQWFKKAPKVNSSPIWQKFAQSGHPGLERKKRGFKLWKVSTKHRP
jgi:hypothetical protein